MILDYTSPHSIKNTDEEESSQNRTTDIQSDVKSPSHYAVFKSQSKHFEAIEVIARSCTHEEWVGFCKGNALKYRLRAGRKTSGTLSQDLKALQDLNKAEQYQIIYDKYKHLTIDYDLF